MARLGDEEKLTPPEDLEIHELEEYGDHSSNSEDDALLMEKDQDEPPKPPQPPPEPKKSSFWSSLIWMTVNTLATIGIVNPPPPLCHLHELTVE